MLKEDSVELKNISFEDFLKKSFLPLVRKVDDLEAKLKKEQEGLIKLLNSDESVVKNERKGGNVE